MLKIKNLQEFKDLAKTSQDYFVIEFSADWCGYCKIMKPIFEEISESQLSPKIKFATINRDENRELINIFNFEIPTIPRYFLVKFVANEEKIEIIKKLGGSQSKTDMILQIQEALPELNLTENIQTSPEKPVNNPTSNEKRVAIIGSGPAGLTAGIYTSRAQLKTKIYLGLQPGGQLTTTTELENFPGAWDSETKKGMMGPDLMQLIQKQAEYFGAETELSEVKSLTYNNNPNKPEFTINTGTKEEKFDAVIVASGASAKYLNLPGEEKFIGKGYHSCATCDGFFYRGKIVGIVGGGDSAMEEANFLTRFAEKVYIIHRREEFRASKIMQDRAINNPKIEVLWNQAVSEIVGQEVLDYVILENTKTGEKSKLKIDGLFVAIGHIPNSDFVGNLLDKDNAGYLIPQWRVDPQVRVSKYNMATKIPGVFVAGDIEDIFYRQAITASGDGCRAAMECEKWLEELAD